MKLYSHLFGQVFEMVNILNRLQQPFTFMQIKGHSRLKPSRIWSSFEILIFLINIFIKTS